MSILGCVGVSNAVMAIIGTSMLIATNITYDDLELLSYDIPEQEYIKLVIVEQEPVEEYNEEFYFELMCEKYADDIDMLAHIINAECGGWEWCTDEMCYYTGSVVLNRVYSDWFPDTIEEVIFQQGQYAPVMSGSYYDEPNERSVRIAKDLIAYGSQLPSNVVFQANFKQGDGVYVQVQNMYFCYKGEKP